MGTSFTVYSTHICGYLCRLADHANLRCIFLLFFMLASSYAALCSLTGSDQLLLSGSGAAFLPVRFLNSGSCLLPFAIGTWMCLLVHSVTMSTFTGHLMHCM